MSQIKKIIIAPLVALIMMSCTGKQDPENLNNMDFLKLAQERYSCKKMNGVKVAKEQLDIILEAGRVAPTAKNLQEQHIYVVESPEMLAKIDSATPCRYNASTVLIVAWDKNNVYTYPNSQRNSGAEDATIVATHMMLAAKSVGVESCWINCFDESKLKELFSLHENEEVLMLLDLGYAAEGSGPLANHFSRKPIEETVTRL